VSIAGDGLIREELEKRLAGMTRKDIEALAKQAKQLEKSLALNGPQTPDELHAWLRSELDLNIPRVSVCETHRAPFEFLSELYFENVQNAIGLANRGGSKTFLVAVLHLLNSKFKPGVECLAGDTLVDCPRDHRRFPDGVPISQMRIGQLVWSFDVEEWKFSLRRVLAVIKREQEKQVFSVALDSGAVVRASSEHPFMLRDGTWKHTSELSPGDSLMPLYRDFEPYVRRAPDGTSNEYEYDLVVEQMGGRQGKQVDHVDGWRANTSEDNLQLLTAAEHNRKTHTGRVHARSSGTRKKSGLTKPKPCVECEAEFIGYAASKWCADCAAVTSRCLACGGEFQQERWARQRETCNRSCAAVLINQRKKGVFNHKIVSITPGAIEEVWDLTVEGTHNFVVSGIVVHNSCTVGAVEAQARRAYMHLGKLLERIDDGEVDAKARTQLETRWKNGSRVEILAGTMNAVNGPHPQKVHADEVELMDPAVFDESQNMPQSVTLRDGRQINSQYIVTSTRKRGHGPMQKLVDSVNEAKLGGHIPPYELFIWCVTGDTPIDCPRDYRRFPEGIPVSQMKIGQLVWSFNEAERKFELKRVKNVAITKRDAPILKLTLDSGYVIRATKEHKFLLRSGEWKQLGQLKPGDSLLPLYRDFDPYVRIHPDKPQGGGKQSEFLMVADASMGERAKGTHVHHVNGWRSNTAEDNLQPMTGTEHQLAEWELRRAQGVTALGDNLQRAESVRAHWASMSPEERSARGVKIQKSLSDKQCKTCNITYTPTNGRQLYCDNCRGFNHKVASIEPDGCEDVWDMEVEDNHNFVVHGVVLHNCIFETAAQVPNCQIANPSCADKCPCDNVVNGHWDNGSPRRLLDVCQGRLAKSDGWIPFGDIIRDFTTISKGVWEAQKECLRPSTQGLVIPQISRERHGIRYWDPDPAHGPIFTCVDWGGTNEHCVSWYQYLKREVIATGAQGQPMLLKEGSRICFDEIYIAEIGNRKLGEKVITREQHWKERHSNFRIAARFSDPQGKAARLDWIDLNLITRWYGGTNSRDIKEQIKLIVELVDLDMLYADLERCVTGDTLIAVADGRGAVPIKELVGTEVDVYASDGAETVVRKMRNIRLVEENAELLSVKFDDGTQLRCTPEHKLMLRDGTYARADELQFGDSLMRFESEVDDGRRRIWMGPKHGTAWKHQYEWTADRLFGKQRKGLHVHHKDGDSLNDCYDNLELVPTSEHLSAHARSRDNSAIMKQRWAEKTDEERAAISKAISEGRMKKSPEERSEMARKGQMNVPAETRRANCEKMNEARWAKGVNSVYSPKLCVECGNEYVPTSGPQKYCEECRSVVYNHSVVSVEPAGRADVFCGQVDDVNNFAIVTSATQHDTHGEVLSGIVVHNCPNWWDEIEAWHYPPKKAGMTDDPDVPVDDFDHAMSCLRYFSINLHTILRAKGVGGGGAPTSDMTTQHKTARIGPQSDSSGLTSTEAWRGSLGGPVVGGRSS
jgi:intein/homing endonuclease